MAAVYMITSHLELWTYCLVCTQNVRVSWGVVRQSAEAGLSGLWPPAGSVPRPCRSTASRSTAWTRGPCWRVWPGSPRGRRRSAGIPHCPRHTHISWQGAEPSPRSSHTAPVIKKLYELKAHIIWQEKHILRIKDLHTSKKKHPTLKY